MTKINKPEYYLGNYVDFRFEKIIERHSARGEWKYIPYIKDSKNLFVKMPNGDIFDVQSKEKIEFISFDDLSNQEEKTKQKVVTNLVPLHKNYLDEKSFLKNVNLSLELLNFHLEQSGEWIIKDNVTIDKNGLFNYSGLLNDKQKAIMTSYDNIMLALSNNGNQLVNNTYTIEDDVYVGFELSEEIILYNDLDEWEIGNVDFVRTLNFKVNPRVRLLRKEGNKFRDYYSNELVYIIDEEKLKKFREEELINVLSMTDIIHSEHVIGVTSVLPLSDFLNQTGIIINSEETMDKEINEYYDMVTPYYINDEIPDCLLPKNNVVLTKNLTK